MTKSKLPATLKILLPISIMAIIFIFSMEGGGDSGGRSRLIAEFLGWPECLVRKLAHITLFGLLGASWFNLFRKGESRLITKIALSTMLVMLYAVCDELHQVFVPGRAGLISDVFIDTAGGLGFVLIFALIEHLTTKSPSKNVRRST